MRLTFVLALVVAIAVGLFWWTTRNPTALDSGLPIPPVQPAVATPSVANPIPPIQAPKIERGAESRTDATPEPVATSTAMESLTLGGHLESRIRDLPWNTDKVGLSNGMELAQVLVAPDLNPQKKVLSAEQTSELTSLLDKQRQEASQLMSLEGTHGKAALLRAVAAGQFASTEFVNARIGDVAAMAKASRDQREASTRQLDDLTARLGKPLEDWGYSKFSSTKPDGIPRQTIVYYTAAQEPQLFEVRKRLMSTARDHREAVRQFFARIP